jgi:hypothetical protein
MAKLRIVAAIGAALVLVFSYATTAAADSESNGHDNSCCHGDE